MTGHGRDDSGPDWRVGRVGEALPLRSGPWRDLGRAVVRGLGPGTDAAPTFEYKVPFGIMDTAQSWPFVVFKQIMIPTFQTI